MSLYKTIALIEAVVIVALVSYLLLPKQATQVQIAPPLSVQSQPSVQRPVQTSQATNKRFVIPKPQTTTKQSDFKQDNKQSVSELLDPFLSITKKAEFEDLARQNGDALFRMLEDNPALKEQVLHAYSQTNNPDVQEFFFQLLVSSEPQDLEDKITQRLEEASQQDAKKWFKILGFLGASTEKSRRLVLQKMQDNDNQSIVLGLQALRPFDAYSQERKRITTELQRYLQHHDDNVRASALRALGQWSRNDDKTKEALILQGLNDPSSILKFSAVISTYEANIKSDKIKNKLLQIMHDNNQNIEDRFIAANALEQFKLSDKEHDARITMLKNMQENHPDLDEKIDKKLRVIH